MSHARTDPLAGDPGQTFWIDVSQTIEHAIRQVLAAYVRNNAFQGADLSGSVEHSGPFRACFSVADEFQDARLRRTVFTNNASGHVRDN